ncbi:MAG: FadR family transcriptional regulator [Desulfobacteraceae bacterium]|nr:FadR family transcriptional regulator [Desulfobacteraceae bacterium]
MPSFNPVKQNRVSDEVMDQLKNAVLTGKYTAGDKLPSERELTEMFQVSRVVIREALRSLEIRGFVSIRQGPKGGAYVRQLSFDGVCQSFFDLFLSGRVSVTELIQARQLVQPEVARLSAINLEEASANLLRSALVAETAEHKNHGDRVRARMSTDQAMAKMCGNNLYRAIMETLIHLTQVIILEVKPEKLIFHDQAEHEAIIDAILAQDGPRAAAEMSRHLNTVGEGLMQLEAKFRKTKGLIKF